MADVFDSIARFLPSSKRTALLVLTVVVITIAISTTISILLERRFNLRVPSLGTIKTIGLEAYWDVSLENKTETLDWGMIWPGSSKNATFYLRNISNVEVTLYLNTTNWNPADISEYLGLSWNYKGTIIHPGEIIQVTLTLTASSSRPFVLYLITNNVEEFSFDIIIGTSEYRG